MKDFSIFKGRKNYVQATESTLQLIWMPGYATGKLLKKRIGFGYNSIIGIHRDDFAKWLYDQEDLEKITERVLRSQEKNPKYVSGLINLWKKDLMVFRQNCEFLEKLDLKRLHDEEFVSEYLKFTENYYLEWSIPIVADAISLQSESVARHGLINLLKKKGRRRNLQNISRS